MYTFIILCSIVHSLSLLVCIVSVNCKACGDENYCSDCNRDLHNNSKMRNHVRTPIGGASRPATPAAKPQPAAATSSGVVLCDNCEENPAT